jgi:hypothetical protein
VSLLNPEVRQRTRAGVANESNPKTNRKKLMTFYGVPDKSLTLIEFKE